MNKAYMLSMLLALAGSSCSAATQQQRRRSSVVEMATALINKLRSPKPVYRSALEEFMTQILARFSIEDCNDSIKSLKHQLNNYFLEAQERVAEKWHLCNVVLEGGAPRSYNEQQAVEWRKTWESRRNGARYIYDGLEDQAKYTNNRLVFVLNHLAQLDGARPATPQSASNTFSPSPVAAPAPAGSADNMVRPWSPVRSPAASTSTTPPRAKPAVSPVTPGSPSRPRKVPSVSPVYSPLRRS